MEEWTGWLGMLLLVIAFLPATIATVRKGKSELKISFLVCYLAGVLLCLYYAIIINGIPFVILNMVLLTLLLVDIYYAIFPRTVSQKWKKSKMP